MILKLSLLYFFLFIFGCSEQNEIPNPDGQNTTTTSKNGSGSTTNGSNTSNTSGSHGTTTPHPGATKTPAPPVTEIPSKFDKIEDIPVDALFESVFTMGILQNKVAKKIDYFFKNRGKFDKIKYVGQLILGLKREASPENHMKPHFNNAFSLVAAEKTSFLPDEFYSFIIDKGTWYEYKAEEIQENGSDTLLDIGDVSIVGKYTKLVNFDNKKYIWKPKLLSPPVFTDELKDKKKQEIKITYAGSDKLITKGEFTVKLPDEKFDFENTVTTYDKAMMVKVTGKEAGTSTLDLLFEDGDYDIIRARLKVNGKEYRTVSQTNSIEIPYKYLKELKDRTDNSVAVKEDERSLYLDFFKIGFIEKGQFVIFTAIHNSRNFYIFKHEDVKPMEDFDGTDTLVKITDEVETYIGNSCKDADISEPCKGFRNMLHDCYKKDGNFLFEFNKFLRALCPTFILDKDSEKLKRACGESQVENGFKCPLAD